MNSRLTGLRRRALAALVCGLCCACPTRAQEATHNGAASAAANTRPLTIFDYLRADEALSAALLQSAGSEDKAVFRTTAEHLAGGGDLGAELLLGETYIPVQCTLDWNKDDPDCGSGKERSNPKHKPNNLLDITPSYEQAANWLEMASAGGVGEASEVLAELITRMLANGHKTTYTATESTRLHALARSQNYDLEALQVTCYQLTGGDASSLTVTGGNDAGREPHPAPGAGFSPIEPPSAAELTLLQEHGVHGIMRFGAGWEGGTVLLQRPEGPIVHIRFIYDHLPDREFIFPVPSHHDVLYVQRGKDFIPIPEGIPAMPRSVKFGPATGDSTGVSLLVESLDGGFSGGTCSIGASAPRPAELLRP